MRYYEYKPSPKNLEELLRKSQAVILEKYKEPDPVFESNPAFWKIALCAIVAWLIVLVPMFLIRWAAVRWAVK